MADRESPMEVDDHDGHAQIQAEGSCKIPSSTNDIAQLELDLHANESYDSDLVNKDNEELTVNVATTNGIDCFQNMQVINLDQANEDDDDVEETNGNIYDVNGEDEQEQDFRTEAQEDSQDGITEDPLMGGLDNNSQEEDEESNSNLISESCTAILGQESNLKNINEDDEDKTEEDKQTNQKMLNSEKSSIEPEILPDVSLNNHDKKNKSKDNEENVIVESDLNKDIIIIANETEQIECRNRGKDTSNNPTEITLDDDENEDHEVQPIINVRVDGIFEQKGEDDDDEEIGMDPDELQNMLQMSISEGHDQDRSKSSDTEDEPVLTPSRSRPRRAAATAAANTIREITVVEEDVEEITHGRRGRKNNEDRPFEISDPDSTLTPHTYGNRQKCHVCKKMASCQIKIQQFGTDVYICSNICFNNMRYPSSNGKRRLQCAQCGLNNQDIDTTYYWETMNFCSDHCVGNYQIGIGKKCATCLKNVPWLSMGKYCVRFGSDIRQFCAPSCLESYKKNARVCFHCQLDIKRLGNVILANIPSKTTPKEFCSQDCVEMYVESNLHQAVRLKSASYTCVMCSLLKECYKELILPSANGLKTCSQHCWNKLVDTRKLTKITKCETCTKYINLDYDVEPPAHYVSTEARLYGFCSATCKNVFVLKNRQILSCTTCKVKKYNYDLVQLFNDKVFAYAICSLNCLPKSTEYIDKLKDTLTSQSSSSQSNQSISQQTFTEAETVISQFSQVQDSQTTSFENFPVINSVTSISSNQQNYFISSDGSIMNYGDSVVQNFETIANQIVNNSEGLPDFFPDVTQGVNIVHADEPGYDVELIESLDNLSQSKEEACWDGIIRDMNVKDMLDSVPARIEMKSKSTLTKPVVKESDTQTEESAILDMERIPWKTQEKIRYVPMPIPYPVYLPTPVFLCKVPVPYPFLFPIPVPIPIPILFDGNGILRDADRLASIFKINEPPKVNGNAMDTSQNSSDSDIVELEPDNQEVEHHVSLVNGGFEMDKLGAVEMMDCTSPSDGIAAVSPDIPPAVIPVTFNNVTTTQTNCNSSSLVVVTGSNSPFTTSISNSPISNVSEAVSSPGGRKKLTRVEYGLRAWKTSFGTTSDPLNYSSSELALKLAEWVKKGTKPNGERYRADIILYLCLGVQQHIQENNRSDSIFYDVTYHPFVEAITNYAESDCAQGINTRIEDNHFWESNQLGSSSPGVLLFTLIFFIYKNFNLKTWEKLASLHFDQIRLEKKSCDVLNTFNPKIITIANVPECDALEVFEKPDEPERCPVKYFELYLSKCHSKEGPFFKAIKGDFSSGDWFTNESLDQMQLYRMLIRAMMIKTDSESR